MIHYLFNNIFVEQANNKSQNLSVKDNFAFPINDENDLALFGIIDTFEKAQQMFSLSGSSSEYADLVNYIEINLIKPEVLRKLYKAYFAFLYYI